MKSSIWRLHFNAVIPLVSLLDAYNLTVDWTDPNCCAIRRICQCSVAGNAFPSFG